ncbi:Serine phosphatase RsbU, regulator of sigma subunit [Nocardioides sp. AX2bis]|nr:Serine phosphatase RsbU, regulator of sigma subunit [Nocardioides sp. AX2bis]
MGWTDNRHVVLVDTHDDDTTRLLSHRLDGGRSQVITSVDGTSSYGVGSVQLASALLSDMEVRGAGTPDRGSIPELRLALAVLLGLAVTALAARLPRRRSRP